MRKLYVEIPNNVGSTFREATEEEATIAADIGARRDASIKQLAEQKLLHARTLQLLDLEAKEKEVEKVFYDTDGIPYFVRHYVATGEINLI